MAIKIRFRGDTAANWTAADPVLDARELGVETDTGKAKLGDGATAWIALDYWARDGERWWTYDGVVPDDLDGEDGDLALRVDTGDIFEKAAGAWGVAIGNIMGADGAPGTNGQGVPVGGTAGQVLAKIDAVDYNTEWVDQSGGGGDPAITEKTADYTLTEDDNGDIIEVDATSAAVTITLPAGLSDGFQCMIVKTDASANAVTLAGDGTSTLVGKGTQLTAQDDVATLYRKTGDVYRAVGDLT